MKIEFGDIIVDQWAKYIPYTLHVFAKKREAFIEFHPQCEAETIKEYCEKNIKNRLKQFILTIYK